MSKIQMQLRYSFLLSNPVLLSSYWEYITGFIGQILSADLNSHLGYLPRSLAQFMSHLMDRHLLCFEVMGFPTALGYIFLKFFLYSCEALLVLYFMSCSIVLYFMYKKSPFPDLMIDYDSSC